MTTDLPLVTRYLNAFDAALVSLAPTERAEVVAEIRQHIADATDAGKPIDEVLQSLGSVDALARAYQLELLVTPRPNAPKAPRSDRWLRIIGLLAIGSIPTLVIVVTLGAIGISFTLSGIAVFVAGLMASAGSLPYWMTMDVEPWVAIVLSVVMFLVGLLCSWGTIAYLRFVVRVVRRVVPDRAPASL